MAHKIFDNMIAYKNETPWHGLGVNVDANATGAEMLKDAKLDWRVQRRAIAMRNANGDPIPMLTEPLKSYRAIVRSDNDHVFQVSTDRYNLVQNEQVIDLFREYCEAGHASMETVGGLEGGSKIWALARLNGGSTKFVGKSEKDELRGYVLMATSHDGSLRTIAKTTQVRVVCWNTLSAALFDGSKNQFSLKHSAKWTPERAAEAQEAMGIAMEQIQQTNELSSRLADIAIDQKGRVEFVYNLLQGKSILDQAVTATNKSFSLDDAIAATTARNEDNLNSMGKAILEAMLTSPGSELDSAKDTLWGAVNGVTYYADHQRGRTQDGRLSSAWFGDSDILKKSAMRVAQDMAGIR